MSWSRCAAAARQLLTDGEMAAGAAVKGLQGRGWGVGASKQESTALVMAAQAAAVHAARVCLLAVV